MITTKRVKNILIVFLVVLVCLYIFSCIVKMKENLGYRHTYIWDKIEKLNNDELIADSVDSLGIVDTVIILFYDKSMWKKLPLSDNFIKKFKNPRGIIRKYYDYETISGGRSDDYDKENIVFIDCVERENILYYFTGKNITTFYTFEYVLDENNKLDDLILLKEVDIDSMTAETYDVREY